MKKYKSKITTVAAAFKACGVNMKNLPDNSMFPARHRKSLDAFAMLIIVVEAINMEANGGKRWIPDYTDNNWKYELWHKILADKKRPSGFGVSHAYFDIWISYSGVGSRLQFINRESAIYCFEKFGKLWKDYILF